METLSLAFDRLPVVRSWLPDETLFSFVSRFHRVAGNVRAATTCQQLFGHARQGSAHDFPCHLDELCRRTEERHGTAQDIAVERTLLRYYWHFVDATLRDLAVKAMRGPGIGGLKFSLGLITSRFRANHPLKACLACVAEDRKKFDCAYWHLEHQFPAVWVCRRHGTVLRGCALKSTGVHRFGLLLPEDAEFFPPPDSVPHPRSVVLADVVAHLVASPGTFDRGQAAGRYSSALLARGFRRSNGRIDLDAAAHDFVDFVGPLRAVDELQGLPATSASAKLCLYRALDATRSLVHPVWHAVLIAWLYGSQGAFASAAARPTSPTMTPASTRERRVLSEAARQALITAPSARAAARELHIDVNTVMAWAASLGVTYKRRPKQVKGEVELRLLAELRAGGGKEQVAAACGLSVQAVTRCLRTTPGLHEEWAKAKFEAARTSARERWLSLLQLGQAKVRVTSLRARDPATYAWLYRNDAAWLAVQSESHAAAFATGVSGKRVDWDARDRQLSRDVESIGAQLSRENGAVKLCQVYQRLPELKAKLRALDRLPLTQAALLRVTRTQIGGRRSLSLFTGEKQDSDA